MSVSPSTGAGCVKVNADTITCTPTAAGAYTITVTATADTSKKAITTLTVIAAAPVEVPVTVSLTTKVSPSGTGNVNPSGTTTRNKNDIVSISAGPNTGYVFDNWTGATVGNSTSANTTINMGTSDKTVTANFKSAPTQPSGPPCLISGCQGIIIRTEDLNGTSTGVECSLGHILIVSSAGIVIVSGP